MIYFIQPKNDGPFRINEQVTTTSRPIKIGAAGNVWARQKQLRSDYKRRDLEILGVVRGGMLTERGFHQRFDHLRMSFHNQTGGRHYCEWFLPGNDLIEFIRDETVPLDSESLPTPSITIPTTENFLMVVERAAMRKKMKLEEFIEFAIRNHLADNHTSAYPYRLK